MMNTIVEENPISFKELEKKIFNYVCELGREMTKIMLESYDKELADTRDRTKYRDKGKRATTIKTIYGEVEYQRRRHMEYYAASGREDQRGRRTCRQTDECRPDGRDQGNTGAV